MSETPSPSCCCKDIIFWRVCEETPCPCDVLPEDFVPPVYYSKVPTEPTTMRVSGKVDDLTDGMIYRIRIWKDSGTPGFVEHEYEVDNPSGNGPDKYVWQVAEELAALVNGDTYDVPITAYGHRDGTVYLQGGSAPFLALFDKRIGSDSPTTVTDFVTRWPTGSPLGGCMILGGTGTYDTETSGNVSRISNFAGFSCWGSAADEGDGLLPPCTTIPFISAISGKYVFVVDDKHCVWRAKVGDKTEDTVYGVVFDTDSDPIFTYTVTSADEAGTMAELATEIATALDAALPSGYFATAVDTWVEVRSDKGHRRFGNANNTFAIRSFGYNTDLDVWVVSNTAYYGIIMTGWDLVPVTGTQTAQLIDTQLGWEDFTYTSSSGTDEGEALAYANAFNTWAAATPAFKGFRDVEAERVYWGQQHTGTVPTASGSATALYLDSLASGDNDFYNVCRVVIDSGTGAGQIQTITDYSVVGPTKLATVTPGWTTNPDTDSVFRIYRHVGVSFTSTNPAHPADLRGEVRDVGIHEDRHDLELFWAINGNGGSSQLPMGWSDVGVVRKCCGPQDGAVYAVRFVGTDPLTPFTAYDVTASITVDNENTTGDCNGDGPDDTPADVANKWVTEFNAVKTGIPANVRPTATHIGNGRITLEGAVYGTNPQYAGAFNFGDAGLTAWIGGQVQAPTNGYEEPGAWWHYDGTLTEIPYIPFVGWEYAGNTDIWHAANIEDATIVGSQYADGLDCTGDDPPDSACPGTCHNDCLSLDATVTVTGTVTWREQTDADPCTVVELETVSFSCTAAVFSGCTSVGFSCITGTTVQVGVTTSALCPTFGTFQVTRTEVPPTSSHPTLTATINYAGEGGEFNGEVWEPYGSVGSTTLCDGQPSIIVEATVTFTGSTQWHMGTDETCEGSYQKCLPGANPLP